MFLIDIAVGWTQCWEYAVDEHFNSFEIITIFATFG
jgi:hypothetical protein